MKKSSDLPVSKTDCFATRGKVSGVVSEFTEIHVRDIGELLGTIGVNFINRAYHKRYQRHLSLTGRVISRRSER